MELAGKRILITRPAGRAVDLVQAIGAAGGIAVHVPMLTIEPLDAQRDAEQWQRTAHNLQHIADFRRVIAISINAVHYGMQAFERLGLRNQPGLHAGNIDWYAIGAATAAEFARWNIVAHGGGDGATSEALLALPDLQNVRDESILILRGVGGRETLAGVLRERGARVEYAECYRRSAPLLDAQQAQLLGAGGFDAVCVNSAETLRNLHGCLDAAPNADRDGYRGTPLLVPSERVAQLAAELGFRRAIVAANAGTEATLETLRGLPS